MKERSIEIADGIVALYRSGTVAARTRRVWLFGRKCEPALLKTFLGYELQTGKIRLNCPDLFTARYLKVFAALGCKEIEVPYDLTVTAEIAPQLEELVQRLKESCEDPARFRGVCRTLRQKLASV